MERDISPNAAEEPEPRRLRNLRWMVTALTATMILGVLTIVALLVISMLRTTGNGGWPDAIALPRGEATVAVTRGSGWVAVVTRDAKGQERIRIFDESGTTQRQEIAVTAAP